MEIRRYFDPASQIIIVVTLVLFVVALFTKGFTEALLLETAVFLVSAKLIINTYKNGKALHEIQSKLDELLKQSDRLN